MRELPQYILTLYVYASILFLGMGGALLVVIASLDMLSVSVGTWALGNWYLGWGLITLAWLLSEAASEGGVTE